MDTKVIPLCDLAKIKTKRKHLPFTTILDELQAGISTKVSMKDPDWQNVEQTSKDIIALSASNNTNAQ